MSNHLMVPTLNDAYETRLALNHQERTHSTNTSIETKENSAYIQRKDLALDASDSADPIAIYEQIQ